MISLIAAVSKNSVIGNKGEIPWRLSSDLKRFKELTMEQSVIMGRKTYESIIARLGKPLPDRRNIVVSSTLRLKNTPDCFVVRSFREAIQKTEGEYEVFIIGGESLYKDFFILSDRLYLTEVDVECQGDAFFPEWNRAKWKCLKEDHVPADEKNQYASTFRIYERA